MGCSCGWVMGRWAREADKEVKAARACVMYTLVRSSSSASGQAAQAGGRQGGAVSAGWVVGAWTTFSVHSGFPGPAFPSNFDSIDSSARRLEATG